MSLKARARRPHSPPGVLYAPTPSVSQRIALTRETSHHLDADERREGASRGLPIGKLNKRYMPLGGIQMTSSEFKVLAVIIVVASAVRLFRISQPNSVVFDEVHFGKFASRYIKTTYFVDVHPPLAKLLITLAAFIGGYNGGFDFKDIGKIYDKGVPYTAMRMLPATMGILTIPIAYMTLRALDCRATTAILASLFLTFENGLITQSRHILLDAPVIFFTALTTLMWVAFTNEDKHQPFSERWWATLSLVGLSLGAVVSCKWTGLFTIATIGACTILQLWLLLGDTRISAYTWIRHFSARAICLIALPILFYMMIFQIHFMILNTTGEGDGFMSSEFQHTLSGRAMADTLAQIALGSEISIRHQDTQGGYLHSHPHNYPGGSGQQQITLYPHRDSNNLWRVYNGTLDGYADYDYENMPLEPIVDHMRIKLRHVTTEKSLHSHDVRPPISDVDFQNEVSAYGMPGWAGDMNDDWFMEIVEGKPSDAKSYTELRTLRTTFRLRHALTGCYLFSHKVKLPEWGFEQQEVTCNKQATIHNSLWFVETAWHPSLPADAPKVNYKLPGFLSKFFELNTVMWTTNAGLTDRHVFDSRPQSWPRLIRGINFWQRDHRQIYLIGNPLVWWSSTAAVIAYAAVRAALILRAKRGFRDFDNTKLVKYDALCGFLFIGWGLHYFPFFLMSRQLFLHHYFPALYYAVLLACGVFDFVTSTLKPRYRLQFAAVLVILAIWNYSYLSPLAYGTPWTQRKCQNAQWLKTWDFSCNDFFTDVDAYDRYVTPTAVIEPSKSAIAIDNVPAADKPETTTLEEWKPEPGKDVFAADDVQEKSSAVPQQQQQQKDTPNSVLAPEPVPIPAVGNIKPQPKPALVKADEVVPAAGNVVVPTAAQSESVAATTTEAIRKPLFPIPQNIPVPLPPPAGPIGEEEAARDKVAGELFPDQVI